MTTTTDILEELIGVRKFDRREIISSIQALGMLDGNKRMHHNARRADAQLDALLKSKCGDFYEPPKEDEDGQLQILNSPIVGDDAIARISQLIAQQQAGANANANADAATQAAATQAAAAQVAAAQAAAAQATGNQNPATLGDKVKSGLKTMLPLLASGAIGIAAANYFAPGDTDTRNEFEIGTVPYEPPGE